MSGKAHLLLVVLSVGAIGFILRLVRREALKAKYAMLWLTIGVGLLGMAAVPSLLDTAAGWLGVDYEPTVWIIAGLTFLFILSVHFSWELSRLEDRSRTLAEEVALLRNKLERSGGTEQSTTRDSAAASVHGTASQPSATQKPDH